MAHMTSLLTACFAEGTSTSAAATDAATSSSKAAKQDLSWGERGVPSYLQSSYDLDCELVGIGALNSGELLWQAIR